MRSRLSTYFGGLRGGRAGEAAWVGVSKGVSMCLSLFIAMALSRLMTPDDYGTYLQLLYVYGTLLVVFSLGLPGCYSYFLARVKSAGEGRGVVTKLTRLCVGMGGVFALSLFLLSDQLASLLGNAALGPGLRVFSVVPLAMMPAVGVEGIMVTCRRSRQLACYVCLSRLATLLCVVVTAWASGGDTGCVTVAFVAASVVSGAVGLWLSYSPFRGVTAVAGGLSYGEVMRFAMPVFYAGIYSFIISSSSQFFVSRYFGAGDFAVFSNGFREMPLAVIVTSAVGSVLLPELSRLALTDRDECIGVWCRSVYKSASVVWPVAVFCIVYAPEIMVTLFGESYRCGSVLFRLASLICLVWIVPFFPLMTALELSRNFAKVHLMTAILLVALDCLAVSFFPSLTMIAAIAVTTRLGGILLLFRSVSRHTEAALWRRLPLRDLARLLVASGTSCVAGKGLIAITGITDAPTALVAALALAVMMYMVVGRWLGLEFRPLRGGEVPDNKIV